MNRNLVRTIFTCVIFVVLFLSSQPGWAQVGMSMDQSGSVPLIVHQAESINWQSNRRQLRLRGNVEAQYGPNAIRADTIIYDDSNQVVEAWGSVRAINSQNNSEYRGDYLKFENQNGEITVNDVHVDDRRWFIRAGRVDGQPDTELIFDDGSVTNCNLETPHYDITASTIFLYPGDRMVAYNAVPRIAGVPVFYSPYLTIDLEASYERWEVEPGSSNFKGDFLGVTYHYLMEQDQYPVTSSIYADLNEKTRPGVGTDIDWDLGYGNLSMFYFHSRRKPLLSDTDGERFRGSERESLYRFKSQNNFTLGETNWNFKADVDWSSDQRLENIEFNNLSLGKPSRRTLNGALNYSYDRSSLTVQARLEDRVEQQGISEQFTRNNSILPRITFNRFSSPVSGTDRNWYYSFFAEATRRQDGEDAPSLWENQTRASASRTVSLFPGFSQQWEFGYRQQYNEIQQGGETEYEAPGSGLFTLENTISPNHNSTFKLTYDVEKRFQDDDLVPLELNGQGIGTEADGFKTHSLNVNSSLHAGNFYSYVTTGYDLRNLRDGSLEADSRVISPLLNISSQLTSTLGWSQFFRWDWGRQELKQLNTEFTYEPTRHVLTTFEWNFNRGSNQDFSKLRNRLFWRFPGDNISLRSNVVYDREDHEFEEKRLTVFKQMHKWGLQISYKETRDREEQISFNIDLLDDPSSSGGTDDQESPEIPFDRNLR